MARKKQQKTGTKGKGKATTTNGKTLSEKVLESALGDLEAGKVGIREAGQALGFSSGAPLRSALREAFGEDAYQAAITAGRAVRGAATAKKAAKPSKKASAKKAKKGAKK